jgi:hypothetical protein
VVANSGVDADFSKADAQILVGGDWTMDGTQTDYQDTRVTFNGSGGQTTAHRADHLHRFEAAAASLRCPLGTLERRRDCRERHA